MSREFMNVCQTERGRLLLRISTTEQTLATYRQMWKLYGEIEKVSPEPKVWATARRFIEETVSPTLKAQLALYQESLENVTRAQEAGCMEIANG